MCDGSGISTHAARCVAGRALPCHCRRASESRAIRWQSECVLPTSWCSRTMHHSSDHVAATIIERVLAFSRARGSASSRAGELNSACVLPFSVYCVSATRALTARVFLCACTLKRNNLEPVCVCVSACVCQCGTACCELEMENANIHITATTAG